MKSESINAGNQSNAVPGGWGLSVFPIEVMRVFWISGAIEGSARLLFTGL